MAIYLESQCRAALHAVGATVICGVVHGDQIARDSLVFDGMEGLRGEVDHLVLGFIQQHVFGASDFLMQNSGAVTIHPSLCRTLVEAVRLPQRRADDEARWLKAQILAAAAGAAPTTTLPTASPTRRKRR